MLAESLMKLPAPAYRQEGGASSRLARDFSEDDDHEEQWDPTFSHDHSQETAPRFFVLWIPDDPPCPHCPLQSPTAE